LNDAVVLLDKPAGRTSFDVINDLKRYAGVKKIGHSGTLDKFASGLLVVCTGKFTKLTRYFLESDKRYSGTIQFGIETDTCDITGEVISDNSFEALTGEKIIESVSRFKGKILQVPPGYSSLKIKGKRASDRVRNGEVVVLEPRNVEIFSFDITSQDPVKGTVDFDIMCSKGTYIRAIARDLGRELGCGACLSSLRRLESGSFNVASAISPDKISEYTSGSIEPFFVVEPQDALKNFSRIVLDKDGVSRVSNGAFFARESVTEMETNNEKKTLLLDADKNLIAIADIDMDKWIIQYDSVFNH
jgi:tRNA pseudouridine55 synthase